MDCSPVYWSYQLSGKMSLSRCFHLTAFRTGFVPALLWSEQYLVWKADLLRRSPEELWRSHEEWRLESDLKTWSSLTSRDLSLTNKNACGTSLSIRDQPTVSWGYSLFKGCQSLDYSLHHPYLCYSRIFLAWIQRTLCILVHEGVYRELWS